MMRFLDAGTGGGGFSELAVAAEIVPGRNDLEAEQADRYVLLTVVTACHRPDKLRLANRFALVDH